MRMQALATANFDRCQNWHRCQNWQHWRVPRLTPKRILHSQSDWSEDRIEEKLRRGCLTLKGSRWKLRELDGKYAGREGRSG